MDSIVKVLLILWQKVSSAALSLSIYVGFITLFVYFIGFKLQNYFLCYYYILNTPTDSHLIICYYYLLNTSTDYHFFKHANKVEAWQLQDPAEADYTFQEEGPRDYGNQTVRTCLSLRVLMCFHGILFGFVRVFVIVLIVLLTFLYMI